MAYNSKSELSLLLPSLPQPITSLSFRKLPSLHQLFYPCGPNMLLAGATQGALAPGS